MTFEVGDEVIIMSLTGLGYDDYIGRTGRVEHLYIRVGDSIPDAYRVRFLDGESAMLPPGSLALWGFSNKDYEDLFI